MKDEIVILSCIDGVRSEFSAKASLTRSRGGMRVRYVQDGDAVTLSLFPNRAVLKREGENAYRAEFAQGSRTDIQFFLGDGETAVPLQTSGYTVSEEGGTFLVRLDYSLLFEGHSQHFEQEISVKSISEDR